MIIELSGSEIFDALNAIQGLNVPIKMKYALNKTARDLRDAAEVLEAKRQDLVAEYGSKNEKGDFEIDTGDRKVMGKFRAEWEKARAEKFPIDVHMIKLSYLDEHNVPLTVAQVASLYFMFEDDLE